MAATVVACVDLDAELRYFTEEVGFRIAEVRPADDPRCVVIERGGTRLELRRAARDRPAHLRIEARAARPDSVSPGGTTLEFAVLRTEPDVPTNRPSLVVVDPDSGEFGRGRAGMYYRDLLPGRWGGRFIASHIRIDEEGDVADWVHFHRIRFQMIYVAAGWVDVVYEGQGEPFRMVAGDCVLQPPRIRHRVLRCSAGLEVIEIGCPAEHDTIADHDLELPTPTLEPDRVFAGQRFVRHVGDAAQWSRWIDPSFTARDTGIADATAGLAGALVVRSTRAAAGTTLVHDGELLLAVGLAGDAAITVGDRSIDLRASTSVAIPPGTTWMWERHHEHEALIVSLPADAVRRA